MLKFPKDFLWGAATSAYQVEGDNSNADWWVWEPGAGREPSGKACNHYELYEQDFDLAKGLNHNAHRLSVEWARIEPKEGRFDEKEIRHYVAVIAALKKRGIEPIVTLHHFTNPIWFAESGGWEDSRAASRFMRYVQVVIHALAPHVRWWITINEPTILFSHAYMFGVWPPQGRSFRRAWKVHDNMADAHIRAYRKIHHYYKSAQLETPKVGISQHITAVTPCTSGFRDRLSCRLRDYWYNFELLDWFRRSKTMDFIGVNYYSRHLVHVSSWAPDKVMGETCSHGHHPLPKNALGWDIYPEGLTKILVKLKRYNMPVMITENGICTDDDKERWKFVEAHVRAVHAAIEQGAPVVGYLYWSLLDNFEWDKGYKPRFGMIHVDYKNFQRIIKESARKFAKICGSGEME